MITWHDIERLLRVHLDNGNRTVAYPLTSIRSWDIER